MKKRKVKIRKTWSINPKERIRENKKAYSRKRIKRKTAKEVKEPLL